MNFTHFVQVKLLRSKHTETCFCLQIGFNYFFLFVLVIQRVGNVFTNTNYLFGLLTKKIKNAYNFLTDDYYNQFFYKGKKMNRKLHINSNSS